MSDQLFTVHRQEIELPAFNEEYYLFVFSDVHRHAYNHDLKKWHRYLDFAKKKLDEFPGRVFFLGLGDYDDFASTSERMALQRGGFHDTTIRTMDDLMQKKTEDFCKELEFMKGHVIGLIEGNHHYMFQNGVSSTQKMCEYLQCRYLGGVSMIRLTFKKTGSKKAVSCDIYAHHTAGSKGGGGRRLGSGLNKLEDMTHVWDADIYLAGHDHKFNMAMPTYLYLDNLMKVKEKDRLLVRTGSFQKGWMTDETGYVPTFNGQGNFLGAPLIILKPTRRKANDIEEMKIEKSLVVGSFF